MNGAVDKERSSADSARRCKYGVQVRVASKEEEWWMKSGTIYIYI